MSIIKTAGIMNITSINFINKVNIPFKANITNPVKNGLNRDTFTRNTPTDGKDSQSFENFELWAKENDFLSNVRNIVEKTGKILGSGFEGTTVEIPDTENWVVKQYKRNHFLPIHTEKPKIIKLKDIAPELNIGQPIALVQIPSGNPNYTYEYWVLKRQTGDTYGTPYAESGILSDYASKKHVQSLKQAAMLPQGAYDKCISDIGYITGQGYAIDYNNPNNIMIDKEMKEFHFVDINDKLDSKKEQYAKMLYSLLDAEYGMNFALSDNDVSEKAKSEELSGIIIKKFFTGMKNQNVKFAPDGFINSLLDTNILDGVLNSSEKEEKITRLVEEGLL